MKKLLVLITLLLSALSAFGQQNKTNEKPLAPSFFGVTLDGARIDMNALKGKVVVLNLWFINCPNCIQEISLLNQDRKSVV